MPENECTVAGAKPTNWNYMMKANCVTDIISVRGIDLEIDKKQAALIVVWCDLFISFFIWCALVTGKPLQRATQAFINVEVMTAQDFTVVLKVPPYHDQTKDLKAIY